MTDEAAGSPTEEISKSKKKWQRSKKTRGDYARERREALVLELSRRLHKVEQEAALAAGKPPPRELPDYCGRCARCGRDLHASHLEVDHVDGRSWELTALNRWSRVARMWRELAEGVRLRALCRSCNALGGGRRYYGGRR
jgi:hypothetical protein